MHVPAITANYLAILALIYVALALQVIRLRRSSKAPFSDGGNENLRSAIRPMATSWNTSRSSR